MCIYVYEFINIAHNVMIIEGHIAKFYIHTDYRYPNMSVCLRDKTVILILGVLNSKVDMCLEALSKIRPQILSKWPMFLWQLLNW